MAESALILSVGSPPYRSVQIWEGSILLSSDFFTPLTVVDAEHVVAALQQAIRELQEKDGSR